MRGKRRTRFLNSRPSPRPSPRVRGEGVRFFCHVAPGRRFASPGLQSVAPTGPKAASRAVLQYPYIQQKRYGTRSAHWERSHPVGALNSYKGCRSGVWGSFNRGKHKECYYNWQTPRGGTTDRGICAFGRLESDVDRANPFLQVLVGCSLD
jgi:hypothetical protein